MNAVFLKLLNMSLSATWVVCAVLLLRFLLKNGPKWVHCILWALVAVRLVLPFSPESVLSLLPSAEVLPSNVITSGDIQVSTGFEAVDTRINSGVLERYMEGVTVPVGNTNRLMSVLSLIWAAGMVLMIAYAAFSCFRLRRRVRASVEIAPGVRICDYIGSPFILGILHPTIYLPSDMDDDATDSVLAHERAHLRRGDHWWKPLGYLLLTVYWFNPALWLAYILLCRDIEMACDERVIKEMTVEEKKQYSKALLSCSMPRQLLVACPLAFGEVGVKERVKSVLNYKKPSFWLITTAVIACITVAVCFLTNPTANTIADQFSIKNTEHGILSAGEYMKTFIDPAEVRQIEDFLKDTRIEELPISQDRSEDRPKDYCIRIHSGNGEIILCFDNDFSDVWVNDGVKPSLSYRLYEPSAARGFFSAMMGITIPEPVSGGPDANGEFYFLATVLRTTENSVLVEPVDGADERRYCDQIWVSLDLRSGDTVPRIRVGDQLKIIYDGSIAESYPAQINRVYRIEVLNRVMTDDHVQHIMDTLGTAQIMLFDYQVYNDTSVAGCRYGEKFGLIYLDAEGNLTVLDQDSLEAHSSQEGVFMDKSYFRDGSLVVVVADMESDFGMLVSATEQGELQSEVLQQVYNLPAVVILDGRATYSGAPEN